MYFKNTYAAVLLWLRAADAIRSKNTEIWRIARPVHVRVPTLWHVAL